jgi:cysteinyl-tRNA synthetase
MEAVSGKSPMVRYWLHTGFLNVNGEKMSKSLHNFITIRELLEDWDADTFRFFVLSTHYRSPIDFSKDSLHQSEKSLEKIKKFYTSLDVDVSDVESDLEILKEAKEEFFSSMDDDFNTPKAIASIFKLITAAKNETLDENDKIAIKAFLDDVSQILGVDFNLEEVSAGSDDLYDLILDVRSQLRANKQYELSDKIRDELNNLGYEIND